MTIKYIDKLMTRPEYDKWIKTIPPGVCVFCNWKKYQIVLKEGRYWVWIANIAPYWKRHTMLLPKRHFEDFGDINKHEFLELKKLIKKITDKYHRLGYTRFVYFWRKRDFSFDVKTGKKKFGHFHIHLCDDYDGLWDLILDKNAINWDFKKMINSV